jgi:gentisate 1,2-dioxygenase
LGESYRSTEGTAFNVVEGSGTVEIAGERMRFSMHDIFVVPPWTA